MTPSIHVDMTPSLRAALVIAALARQQRLAGKGLGSSGRRGQESDCWRRSRR